ncbi:MAG: hypothetical protein AAB470_02425 [Patescibacteria group bacterium]
MAQLCESTVMLLIFLYTGFLFLRLFQFCLFGIPKATTELLEGNSTETRTGRYFLYRYLREKGIRVVEKKKSLRI